MDFLLRCPRGPDHQGRHAVPEAESAADGPPWAAGAEKDRTRRKSVTQLHRQRGKSSAIRAKRRAEEQEGVWSGWKKRIFPSVHSGVSKSAETGSVPCAAQNKS